MSTGDESSLRDLAAAYALGALPPEEARAFESYLETSAEARQEVAEMRETAALLALSAREAEPAPGLRARVLEAVSAGRLRPRPMAPAGSAAATGAPPRSAPLLWAALAASLLAAVGLGLRAGRLDRELAGRNADLARRDSTIAEQTRMLDQQGQRLASADSTLASLVTPGVQLVQLTASGDPDPQIQLFWDRRHNTAVLHASRLRPVAQGRTYQLWFIRDGKPVPSITFDVAAGEALVPQVSVPAEGRISAAAVTEEPAGGSPQPTSPVLLVGTLPKS